MHPTPTPHPARLALLLLLGVLLLAAFNQTPRLAAVRAQSSGPSGELAILTDDANIVRYDMASGTASAVTTDADGSNRAYTWPTWATDGRLAFFGYSLQPQDAFSLGIFVQGTDGQVRRAFSSETDLFTYAFWSPGNCSTTPDCRDLAVLYTASNGQLALRNVRDTGKFAVSELSAGGPHYWDWSPDGQQMFWARYGDELALYDVAAAEITTVFEREQGFGRAVDWSPVDDRLLAAIDGAGGGTDLAIIDSGDITVVDGGFRAGVSAAWSPDGQTIAYLNEQDGSLSIIDAALTAATRAIVLQDQVLAFWWSPDAQQLAFLQLVLTEDEGPVAGTLAQRPDFLLVWRIYDVAADRIRRGPGFLPTDSMIYYLNFYDQFSRSHRLWSPDSRYLTYGAETLSGTTEVNVIDTQAAELAPTTIRAGEVGVFSWQ